MQIILHIVGLVARLIIPICMGAALGELLKRKKKKWFYMLGTIAVLYIIVLVYGFGY